MPRTSRYIEPNGYYHVISRSINEAWIFKDRSDFLYFLKLEQQAKKEFPVRLFHYVLMNTHFHFVLQAVDKDTLAQHFSFIKWRYTNWVCKKYGWKGPMWRERYRSLPIENETYLTACGAYVEYNPVRAGICTDPADYLFSSYRKYHLDIPDNLLDNYDNFNPLNSFADKTGLTKSVFSRAPAIGSPAFVEKWRTSQRQKCLSPK